MVNGRDERFAENISLCYVVCLPNGLKQSHTLAPHTHTHTIFPQHVYLENNIVSGSHKKTFSFETPFCSIELALQQKKYRHNTVTTHPPLHVCMFRVENSQCIMQNSFQGKNV